MVLILDPARFSKPVARKRVWILGIPRRLADYVPRAELENLAKSLIDLILETAASSEKDLDLDFHLLEENDPLVLKHIWGAAESASRQGASSSQDTTPAEVGKKRKKWVSCHDAWCCEQGKNWFDIPGAFNPEQYELFPGLRELSDREVDVLNCRGIVIPSATPSVVDVSQSLNRTREVVGGSGCVTPGMRCMLTHRGRLALGMEAMALQGIHYGDRHHLLRVWPNADLMDLAGNAFNVHCAFGSFLVACTLLARCAGAMQTSTESVPSPLSEAPRREHPPDGAADSVFGGEDMSDEDLW